MALDAVLARIDLDLDAALLRLFAFLAIPSISTDTAYLAPCREAAQWLASDLATIGFEASIRPTPGHPIVLGRSPPAAGRQALFYGHYDVQPVDPLDLWETPPFAPRLADGPDGARRIVARGASDDKGQVMTFVEACRAWVAVNWRAPHGRDLPRRGRGGIRVRGTSPPSSPRTATRFAPTWPSSATPACGDARTPAITTSLRGMVYVEVRIRAASRDLHSGLFGGAARNPIHVLAGIVAALHDETGRVTLPDFYDGVNETPADVLARWRSLGLDAAGFLGPIGLRHSAGEADRLLIEQIQSRPTADVNGVWGGYTGEGTKTVIPAEASAKISFRLVGNQDPARIADAFEAFARARLPDDCTMEVIRYKGSPAISLPFESPSLAKAGAALRDEWGVAPVTIGSGGSIPVVGTFKEVLGVETLLVGFALDEDRIHSPNENYSLESFRKGTRSWARILAALAA